MAPSQNPMSTEPTPKIVPDTTLSPELQSAADLCTRMAAEHYENFPVGSRLIPAEQRRHIHAVYAFARTADDFADETFATLSQDDRLRLLDDWEAKLDRCLAGRPDHPIFEALADSIAACRLPDQLLRDLLSAFRQDVVKSRYANFAEVLDYCRRSANPVGRLVLHIFDYREETLHLLSDHICTGLQLANFWQDISVDLLKDRIYLPTDELAEFGIPVHALASPENQTAMRALVRHQVERTRSIFTEGRTLPNLLDHGLRLEIKLTWLGGMEVLNKIEKLNFDTVRTRPALSKWDFLRLLGKALLSLS
jgi:phytoene synthase